MNIFLLILSLLLIVIAASIFCNALEHLGERLKFSEGVTGSIFASIATALPETIIPILAVININPNNVHEINSEIGIGAILGAPLMLITLSIWILSVSIIKQRGFFGKILPEITGVKRDLKFFIFGYLLAFLASITQKFSFHIIANGIIIVSLGLSYFIYLLLTIKSSSKLVANGHNTRADSPLFLNKLYIKTNYITIVLQLIVALVMLIFFANQFIDNINQVVLSYNISPYLISLIVIPIATELPEKINSVLWLRRGKDTLAIGNITGAMVFQGTLLPILGILFTKWSIDTPLPFIGIVLTLCGSIWFYYNVSHNNIRVWQFMINGVLYLLNLCLCIYFLLN